MAIDLRALRRVSHSPTPFWQRRPRRGTARSSTRSRRALVVSAKVHAASSFVSTDAIPGRSSSSTNASSDSSSSPPGVKPSSRVAVRRMVSNRPKGCPSRPRPADGSSEPVRCDQASPGLRSRLHPPWRGTTDTFQLISGRPARAEAKVTGGRVIRTRTRRGTLLAGEQIPSPGDFSVSISLPANRSPSSRRPHAAGLVPVGDADDDEPVWARAAGCR